MIMNDLVVPSVCSALALLLTWITISLFADGGEPEEEKWWHFYRDSLVVLVKFLFLTLFFAIAVHKILLSMAILTILFILVLEKKAI